MSELPRRLSPGQRLTAHWLNRLLDHLRSLALREGPGIRIHRTPSGTTISADPAMAERPEKPMPFDCRVEPASSGALHWRCFLPRRNDGLVRLANGDVEPPFRQLGGGVVHDWFDVGPAEKGDTVTLFLMRSSSAKTDAEKLASAWWTVATKKPDGPELGPLGPSFPLAEWTSAGIRQLFHGPYLYSYPFVALDTDESPGDPPGESLNRYKEKNEDPDAGAPLQLRQFHDPDDTQKIKAIGETGGDPTVENMHLILRLVARGTENIRPKLVYADPRTGPFWVTGGDEEVNYGTGIKIGSRNTGFITITTTSA